MRQFPTLKEKQPKCHDLHQVLLNCILEIIFTCPSDVPSRIFPPPHCHTLGEEHNQLPRFWAGKLPSIVQGNSAHKNPEERNAILQ
jgi:hypothetical protein